MTELGSVTGIKGFSLMAVQSVTLGANVSLLETGTTTTLGVTPGARLIVSRAVALANGTGANQADRVWSRRSTLAASASETWDLNGVLTDTFGNAVNFVKIKGLFLYAASGNTNNVVLGNAAANAWVGPFGAATHTIATAPDGYLQFIAPGLAGWAVTAGTADQLKVANSGAGTSVTYDLVLVGTSA